MPCVRRWQPSRGNTVANHYRRILDRLEVNDVKWSTYDDHRAICPFQLICPYSEWLVCGKERVHRHLPEWVKRQYIYIQNIPRHRSYVLVDMVANMSRDYHPWCITEWGQRVERLWQHTPSYMASYAKVSHPKIIPPDDSVGTKGVSQNHLLSFDDNKVLKLSIGNAKHLFKCTWSWSKHYS